MTTVNVWTVAVYIVLVLTHYGQRCARIIATKLIAVVCCVLRFVFLQNVFVQIPFGDGAAMTWQALVWYFLSNHIHSSLALTRNRIVYICTDVLQCGDSENVAPGRPAMDMSCRTWCISNNWYVCTCDCWAILLSHSSGSIRCIWNYLGKRDSEENLDK